MESREGYTVELRSVIRLVLEVACYCILAVAATLAIAGIRTSLEPTANPTGMTEIGYALVVLSILVALWRFVWRSRGSRF